MKLLSLIANMAMFIFIAALITRVAIYLHSIGTHFTMLVAYYSASVVVIIFAVFVITELKKPL